MNILKNLFQGIIVSCLLLGCSSCGPSNVDIVTETSEVANPIHWDECSNQVGDHACDFTLMDQNGKNVSLYDLHGKVVLIDFSTEWCGYCQLAAQDVQSVQDFYGEGEFAYITILVETSYGVEPTIDDLARWADNFGITSAPVLAGSRGLLGSQTEGGWDVTSWPTFFILDKDLQVSTYLKGYNQEWLESLIEETFQK